jgi:hypothetical protein
MEIPKFDPSKPTYIYIEQMKKYCKYLDMNNYIIIKNFLNILGEIDNKKYDCLTDFTKINYLNDTEKNKNILLEYGIDTAKSLNVEFDFENINDDSMFNFLEKILITINYYIVNKINNKKENCYYITNRKPKRNKKTL